MNSKIRNTAFIGLMTAVCVVLSVWQLPMPFLGVPMTLQTFAVALSGHILGKWRGSSAVLAYIVMGAVGLPVFTGFQGGIGVLAGPTGGFILGFLPLAFFCGLSSGRRPVPALALSFAGLLVCHAFGVLHFSYVTGNTLWSAFLVSSLPYLIKDAAMSALSYFLARIISKREIVK